jgi:hypothetical protein
MRVAERRPEATGDARAITERYWEMEARRRADHWLFEEWDGFRSRTLAFMRDYDIILCPVDHRSAGPSRLGPAHGTERGDISTYLGAGDPLRFNYTLPFSLCSYPAWWSAWYERRGHPSGPGDRAAVA